MSASDLHAQLQEAITLAQAGQRSEARAMLRQIVEADPEQELAWLWLATVSTRRDERIAFLERALALNPDNATSRQAYVQLTGREYVPPVGAPMEPPGGRWSSLTRDRSLSLTQLVILMLVAAAGVAAIVIVLSLRDDGDETAAPIFTPTLGPVTETPTPTSRYSPTPSNTPRPTSTPGPSPTSVWDNPPPTWTPPPTLTTVPSLTPLPSSTPLPTSTITPTVPPRTPTDTRIPASATVPPLFPAEEDAEPTLTRTPAGRDATATAQAEPALTVTDVEDESFN